jgi:hypothetical protein
MSRNKQQGKYAGKLGRKHYRTRLEDAKVSIVDCYYEEWARDHRAPSKAARDFFGGGDIGIFRLMRMRVL